MNWNANIKPFEFKFQPAINPVVNHFEFGKQVVNPINPVVNPLNQFEKKIDNKPIFNWNQNVNPINPINPFVNPVNRHI